MIDIPKFVNGNHLTDEGQRVIEHIQQVLEQVGDDPAALNGLAGPYKSYRVNVLGPSKMSPKEWAESFGTYGMQAVWSDLDLRERETSRDKTVSDIEAELASIKEALLSENEQLKKEVSSLKGQNTKLKNKLAEAEGEEADIDSEEGAEESETEGADDETVDETTGEEVEGEEAE